MTLDQAEVRAEVGYVDFLRGRYDRAEYWFTDALTRAAGEPAVTAKVLTYLGSVESDRGRFDRASELLGDALEWARSLGDPRPQAYAETMLGRSTMLLGDVGTSDDHLRSAIRLARDDHWLVFLPWPQAIRGQVQLLDGQLDRAAELLDQAFARACQLGDPCWEGMSARGLAMLAEQRGDTDRAFTIMIDARQRADRLVDPYVWLDGYILSGLGDLGRRHDHPQTAVWTDALDRLVARTGMSFGD